MCATVPLLSRHCPPLSQMLLLKAGVTRAGDSIIRNLALSVAALLADAGDPPLQVERHADMVFSSGCNTTITFLWRPFLANVTQAMADWSAVVQRPPAHVITGVALWDVLHITDTRVYAAQAEAFANVVAQLLQVCCGSLGQL